MTTGICLPAELLTAIFKEVEDIQDLRHVRLACRTLCASATPIAFRVLSVTRTRGSAQYLGRLLDNSDIAVYVRKVFYRGVGAERKEREPEHVRANTICELVSSFSRIHLLPQLETINLTFYPTLGRGHQVDYDSEDSLSLQPSLLAALSKSFSTRAPSKLTSLCLHDLLMSDISPLESPPFQTLLIPTLRCLQLSVIYDIGPDHGRWYNFWNAFFPRTITAPVMHHSLTEFSLHSDMPIGSSSELSFAELFLPNLCTLSLINFVLEPPVGIEPFILRHAATLTRLELLTFGLPVTRLSPLSTSTSPSVTPTGAEESNCSWEDIWDRFAAQLTALIALNIEDCRYCVYGPNRCVWVARVSKSRNAADIAALQRFRTIVALIVAARSGELE